MTRLATGSPRSMRLARATSSAAVRSLWPADVGQEQLEAVGGAGDGPCLVPLLGGSLFLLVDIRLDDLDVVRFELALK